MGQRALIVLLLILAVPLAVFGFRYWRDARESAELVSTILESEVVKDVRFVPSFSSSFTSLEGKGILAVSTGEVSRAKLRDRSTGKIIAESSVLKVVTKNNEGEAQRLLFVLQLTPINSPQRNLIPWITQKAAQLRSLSLSADNDLLTDEQLTQLFPKGSRWIFLPLIDLDSEEIQESIVEYSSYTQKYYGDTFSSLKTFIESDLSGRYSKPILLLDIFYYFEN